MKQSKVSHGLEIISYQKIRSAPASLLLVTENRAKILDAGYLKRFSLVIRHQIHM